MSITLDDIIVPVLLRGLGKRGAVGGLHAATDGALQFALPSFFLHVTATNAILGRKGVPLGKPGNTGSLGPGA